MLREKKRESCRHAFRIEKKQHIFKQGLIDSFVVIVAEANKKKTVHAKD